jgi:hypothetical protein
MTSVDVREPLTDRRAALQERRVRPAPAGLRLVCLHLVSRRVPATLVALAACGAVLRAALHWHLFAGADAQQLPLLIEAGAGALVAVACGSPFGEPERATGRWLPYLRLGATLGLTAAAFAALATGSAAAHLPGGYLAVARNLTGITGIGLLSAAVLGGALAWIGPMAYAVLGEVALSDAWRTPWTWPARPPEDHGAALCAGLVFVAGLVVITVRGARDSVRE